MMSCPIFPRNQLSFLKSVSTVPGSNYNSSSRPPKNRPNINFPSDLNNVYLMMHFASPFPAIVETYKAKSLEGTLFISFFFVLLVMACCRWEVFVLK